MCEAQTELPALTEEPRTANQTQTLLVLMSSTTEQILTPPPIQFLSNNSHRLDGRKAVNGNCYEPIKCEKYNRCGKASCIHCQTIYQGKKTKEVTQNIREKNLIRIILTVKSSPDDELKNLTNKLYHCFKQLRRTAYWRKQFKGGLARLHIDHTGKCWHPHFDIIAEPTAESDLTEAKLSNLWESITNDSEYIHIQTVTKTELSHIKLSTYILKPTFKNIKDNEHLMHVYSRATKGIRKLQRFGKWVNTINRKDWIK